MSLHYVSMQSSAVNMQSCKESLSEHSVRKLLWHAPFAHVEDRSGNRLPVALADSTLNVQHQDSCVLLPASWLLISQGIQQHIKASLY